MFQGLNFLALKSNFTIIFMDAPFNEDDIIFHVFYRVACVIHCCLARAVWYTFINITNAYMKVGICMNV